MVNFKPISNINFQPTLDMNIDACIKASQQAMLIAKNVIGKLQGIDLPNIFDMKFNSRLAIGKNMVDLKALLESPEELHKIAFAFATTVLIGPVKMGYKFDLRNNHQLNEVESILLSYNVDANDLMALHNVFRHLDGLELEYITEDSQTNYMDINQVNALFPYFQLTQSDSNVNSYHLGFTRLDLLEKLNEKLRSSTTHLGYTMYSFLSKGKESDSYSKKYFEKQAELHQLVESHQLAA